MDWKRVTEENLRDYAAKKNALTSIQEEIERLRLSARAIRAASTDSVAVRGGGCAREDMLLTNIVHRQELRWKLADTMRWIARMDKALGRLTEEERLVLDRFYIHPAKGNVDRLCEELSLEKAGVYKRKDKALKRIALTLYG